MANPLTLLMPITAGTNPAMVAGAIAKSQPQIDQGLTAVGTVHFARFLLLDASAPNLQPGTGSQGPFILGVITSYDGDFNAYIQDFVDQIGEVFDALLPFVVGGSALVPVKNNVAAFTSFIQANDASQHAPNTSLYSAYPQTVQQILASLSS